MKNEHIKDANTWLEHAKQEKENHRVACAMAVHSVIKSLDSLFEKFLNETPKRHDKATDYFKRLIRDGHLDDKESKYTSKIQEMLQKKSDAEYKATYFSKRDSKLWLKRA